MFVTTSNNKRQFERKNNDTSLLTADEHIFSGKKKLSSSALESTEFELFPSVVDIRPVYFLVPSNSEKFQLQNKILLFFCLAIFIRLRLVY